MPEPDSRAETPPSIDTARDHLANERTLLAWSRTGITIIALGFVVARFGLALRILNRGQALSQSPGLSTAFGVSLIICGAGLLVLSLRRYLVNGDAIERRQFRWSPAMGIALVAVLVLAGIVLAIYLVLTT